MNLMRNSRVRFSGLLIARAGYANRQKKKSFLTTVLQRFLGNQHG